MKQTIDYKEKFCLETKPPHQLKVILAMDSIITVWKA